MTSALAGPLAIAPPRMRAASRGPAQQRPAPRNEALRPRAAIRWALTALVVGVVLMDRFGVMFGGFSLGLALPLTWVLLAVLLLSGRLEVDIASLLLYCGIASVAVASYLFNANVDGGNATSVASLFLLLTIYLPFAFGLAPRPDNHAHWLWTLRMIGNVLLIAALAGIVQFYAQFVLRAPWLFDSSLLIPLPVRAQGVFNSAIPVGSLLKANGFFSREPSGFSFLMAFGLLVELALFKRIKRMLCFGLALLLSYSGTGLLALAIGLAWSLRPAMLLRLGIGATVLLVGNALAGDPFNLAFTFSRVGEFGAQGSSAYMRYVAPLRLVDANIDVTPWSAWLGHGPGMILKTAWAFETHDPTWAKLLFEYGIAGFVLFLGFMAYKLAAICAPVQFSALLFASWLAMGGNLLSPENVSLIYVVLALWRKPAADEPA
jgi:hypothetical protein